MLNILIRTYLKQNKCNADDGFTLIELLVVVIIIGVLSAVALPNMLGGVAKARQTEAKTHLSAINQAQIAYRLENGKFATTLDQLGVSIPASANNYLYKIEVDEEKAAVLATAKDPATKGYSGGAVMFTNRENVASTGTIICENKQPGASDPKPPLLQPSSNTIEDAIGCEENEQVQVK